MVWYNTIFYKNGVILHACVHGRRKDFSKEGGGPSGFFQNVSDGQKWWNLFLSLETKKTAFLLKNSCPPPDTHACV